MKFLTIACVILLGSVSAIAQPFEPARGSELRAELMDAVRPLVEYHLGAPVEFVVISLEADGDRAFGRLTAQRPGGGPIDMARTPMVLRDGISIDFIDGPRLEVFYHWQAGAWRAINFAIGSTDVWWYGYDCAHYGQFKDHVGC